MRPDFFCGLGSVGSRKERHYVTEVPGTLYHSMPAPVRFGSWIARALDLLKGD